jgi:hypothetical protein
MTVNGDMKHVKSGYTIQCIAVFRTKPDLTISNGLVQSRKNELKCAVIEDGRHILIDADAFF